MHLSIIYHGRLKIIEAKVDNIIKFPDSHYLGLGNDSQFDNGYNFLKECFIILRIL